MQNHKNTAIIVAAGNGSRLGTKIPKQFLNLNGLEILSYSVTTFSTHPLINDVVIVTSENHWEHVSNQYPHCQVVKGGETRQDSVFNGLKVCDADTSNVLVHDAARPLLPSRVIDDCLGNLEMYDGVAPAIAPADSMVLLSEDDFTNLHRDDLRIIQTPQCFKMHILKKAHTSGKIDTDEIGLVKQALPDAKLTFIQGAVETMKITQAQDLEIASMYLRSMNQNTN